MTRMAWIDRPPPAAWRAPGAPHASIRNMDTSMVSRMGVLLVFAPAVGGRGKDGTSPCRAGWRGPGRFHRRKVRSPREGRAPPDAWAGAPRAHAQTARHA